MTSLCSRNFQIVKLRSIRFCVKSILANFEYQKRPFLHCQRLLSLNFGKFGTGEMAQILKNHNSEPLNTKIVKNDIRRQNCKSSYRTALTSDFESFWSIVDMKH